MKESKYHAIVNESHQFEISDEQTNKLDFVKIDEHNFHILHENKAYKAELVVADFRKKRFEVKINGNFHSIAISDEFDLLVDKLGLSIVGSTKIKDVKAPMPGLVLDVSVATGQEVIKGDKLMILEAMKMENVIKSEGEGVVRDSC